ncbi:MAG: zinc metalloprotease HtpX [Thermodesulfobacteriota bacterium]|nr:zinc metalloprotease HtpX [Thermodesulfobacteriota bacterium]
MGNWFRTTFFLGIMTALIVLVGDLLGGRQGMILAFILAIGMNFFSFWFSDKIVLRMYRAREVSHGQLPELYNMVSQIAQRAQLPMPKVFIMPEEAPNAFATGRNPEHAVIAITEGLLKTMDTEELRGVLAHEMAHVKNRDILIGSIAATMAGAIMILATTARWTALFGVGSGDDDEGGGLGALGLIVMSILAPLAAVIIQMAISRSREYHADSTGAGFAGNPKGLAGALEKLGAYSKTLPMEANPSTAHMFIVNPLSAGSLMGLFSTHPPLEDRIARLRGRRSDMPFERQEDRGKKAAEAAWRRLSG